MKNKPSHLENSTKFFLPILTQIMEESTQKGRLKHPLWKKHGQQIVQLYDSIFEQRKTKPLAQKINLLRIELETSMKESKTGVTCQVCGIYTRNRIDQHLKGSHSQDPKEYHGDLWSSMLKEKFSELYTGPKNPWFNHGGKYSPFSKGSVNYSEEAKEKAARNRSYNTRLDYYLNRGMTKEKAEESLSQRQSTFSLEKCLEKYGTDGINVFKNRQETWQDTLNSKPQEEKDRIRMMKSTGRMNQLFNSDPAIKSIPGVLYIVKLTIQDNLNVYWKVGITSKTVKQRFWTPGTVKDGILLELIREHKTTFYDAYKLEQEILRMNRSIRTIITNSKISTTEAFVEEPNYQILLKESS